MWARSDYILGTERRHFEMAGIKEIRNYPTDHLVLLDRLFFIPNKSEHQCDAGDIPEQSGMVHGDTEETGRYHTYAGVVAGRGTRDIVTRR